MNQNFFAELKRRNVYKVAAAYGVVGWLVIQVTATIVPALHLPDGLTTAVVVIVLLGFPIALVISWAFEMTPGGMKRTADVSPDDVRSMPYWSKKKFAAFIIGAVVIATGLLAYQLLRTPRSKSPTVTTAQPNEKSVAVLAFANLSDDKGSEYFSDGISEELLTVLQKIPGLHVAARTSAFSFKGKNVTAQEIGQKLGVAHLVEGSVRKAGDVVRIAARLTQASTGEEQWSENYTRNLKDVFAVQTELAQTIVEQLRGQLAGAAPNSTTKAQIKAEVQAAEKGGTKNVQAHEAYLQGRFFLNRHSEKETGQGKLAFDRAVQLDPQFALAWAGLAQAHVWYCNFSGEGGLNAFNAHLAAAREAVERALSLEPDLPEALLPLATIKINFDHDWKGAAETLRKGLALAPQDAALLAWAGNLAFARGEGPQSVELLRQAIALDPVNAQSRIFLAATLSVLEHQDEARAEYARVMELNPSAPYVHAGLATTYLFEGKFEEAATISQKDAADYARSLVLSCARWAQKRVPESDAALAELINKDAESAAYQIAEAYAYRNDKDHAFEWLDRAYQQRDAGLPSLRLDAMLKNLHGDARWDSFLRKMGLADDQLK